MVDNINESKVENTNAQMKKLLIEKIDELNKGDFLKNLKSEDLGASNIRAMANVALNCDCYEEFRLFMQYKKFKLEGWRKKKDGQELADIVIGHLDKIHDVCHQRDGETLKWISQYFGYFYWKKASVEEVKSDFKRGKNR